MRLFHCEFPGEWVLFEYLDGGRTSFVRIEGNVVSVIFGLYV
jgi:hypothetical protein